MTLTLYPFSVGVQNHPIEESTYNDTVRGPATRLSNPFHRMAGVVAQGRQVNCSTVPEDTLSLQRHTLKSLQRHPRRHRNSNHAPQSRARLRRRRKTRGAGKANSSEKMIFCTVHAIFFLHHYFALLYPLYALRNDLLALPTDTVYHIL